MNDKICIVVCENMGRELAAIIDSEISDDIFMATFPSNCGHPVHDWNVLSDILIPYKHCRHIEILGGCCIKMLNDPPEHLSHCRVHKFQHDFYMLVDSKMIDNYVQKGAYLITPGWLARWPYWIERWGFDQILAGEFFSEVARQLVLLDTGTDPESSAKLQEFSAFIGLPFEILPIGLGYFRLLLTNIIMERRLEHEVNLTTEKTNYAQRQISDYAMTMDLLIDLVKTTSETETIRKIAELFSMLFAAKEFFYIQYDSGKTGRIHGTFSSAYADRETVLICLKGFTDKFAWLESGKGFLLRISRWNKTLGVLLVDDLSFPEYKEHYLNLALSIVSVCGLAIENARAYQKIIENETELKEMHGAITIKNTQLEKSNLQLKEILEKLEISEEKFRGAFEAATHGMVLVNAEGWFSEANEAFCKIIGYSEKEILNLNFKEITHPDDLQLDLQNFGQMISGEMQNFQMEKRYLHKKGHIVWVLLSVSLVRDSKGDPLHFVGQIIDISKRKALEIKLHQQNEALEQSNQDLNDFSYIVSHDLKEPLRGISNFSGFLMEDYHDKLDDEGRSKLETLIRLSKREEHLIDTLLHYSRVGRTDLAYELVDLNEIVQLVADTVTASFYTQDIKIIIQDSLPTLRCDSIRINEVFYNLTTNAVKYNEKPEKRIEIGFKRPLTPDDQDDKPLYTFFVKDNGIGIPEKHLDNIFTIFKRLHGRDKFGGGTGAGLTIVKKIIERHGGNIWVESVYGEGSTFCFTLEGGDYGKEV